MNSGRRGDLAKAPSSSRSLLVQDVRVVVASEFTRCGERRGVSYGLLPSTATQRRG